MLKLNKVSTFLKKKCMCVKAFLKEEDKIDQTAVADAAHCCSSTQKHRESEPQYSLIFTPRFLSVKKRFKYIAAGLEALDGLGPNHISD